ncbi:MAG TPA: ABC transporter substrate-binding protein, partial [Chthoniobacter sp.]|nr:ABC transporter substrate-binding protein [Chthoniobacter sp.]
MAGGCFTISSLGGIGGRHFNPIINAPKSHPGGQPNVFGYDWTGDKVEPRLMLPLSLSWDHRTVGGAPQRALMPACTSDSPTAVTLLGRNSGLPALQMRFRPSSFINYQTYVWFLIRILQETFMNQDSLSLQSGSRRKRQFFFTRQTFDLLRGVPLKKLAAAMLIASACSLFSTNLLAQASLKIGVLTDMSGPYANYTGKGSVEAARMAVEDFGGTVLGKPIEVAFADHQNKPDIGSSIARRWYENEGVSAILDIPVSSIGLAVQEIARQNRKAVLFSASAASTITGTSCSPYGIQWTFDTYSL